MSTHVYVASNNEVVYGWDSTFQTYFVQVRSIVTGKWLAWTGAFPFEHTTPDTCVQLLAQYLPAADLAQHVALLRASAG